jgi:hypothetical protein
MAVPSTIRCEIVWQLNAVDWAVNVLHFTTGVSGPLLGDDVSAMAVDISGSMTSSTVSSLYPSTVRADRIQVRDLRTDGNEPIVRTIGNPGTGAGSALPAQTCLVSTLRTTLGGRRGRGRIYWPAPSTITLSSNGQATVGTQNAFTSLCNLLFSIDAGATGPLILGVYSRTDGTTRSVVSASTNGVFDMQTRRRDLSIT